MKTLIYIASSPRSGSTLLTNLLGNHPNLFNVGEINHVHCFLNNERNGAFFEGKCPCGEKLRDCSIWGEAINLVKMEFGLDDKSLITRASHPRASLLELVSRKYEATAWYNYARKSKEYEAVARNCFSLMNTILDNTGSMGIVDSSKNPHNLVAYLTYLPSDWELKVVHLIRDPRGTAISNLKHLRERKMKTPSFLRQLFGWKHMNSLIIELSAQYFPSKYMQIKYEDFCLEPHQCLRNVMDFIGFECEPEELLELKTSRHDIAGSPSMRRNQSSDFSIRVDNKWMDQMGLGRSICHTLITQNFYKSL